MTEELYPRKTIWLPKQYLHNGNTNWHANVDVKISQGSTPR